MITKLFGRISILFFQPRPTPPIIPIFPIIRDSRVHHSFITQPLNWIEQSKQKKNSSCYQLTNETVNCEIANKTLQWFQNERSSHWRCSIKKVVLKNFAIFTGKQQCWSLFLNKNASLQYWSFIRMRLQCRCFPMNIASF